MSSHSETSYGARIGNAEKLLTALQTFHNYQPQKPEFSISHLTEKIAQIKNQNSDIASRKQNYSLAVENRKQQFEKNPYSIKKILSPINATVKASYGKETKEAIDVAAIIAKIRGANGKSSPQNTPAAVSQSYQSFNSRTQFFSDLIAYLKNFNTNYNPSNNELIIESLETLLSNTTMANNEVMNTYSQFIQNNNIRILAYAELTQTTIRIKDGVKSQYGLHSSEYNLIKSLKI
jgi:hypothetical protein